MLMMNSVPRTPRSVFGVGSQRPHMRAAKTGTRIDACSASEVFLSDLRLRFSWGSGLRVSGQIPCYMAQRLANFYGTF